MNTDPSLLFFAKYIESELGIIYSDHNYFQLKRRLEEIAQIRNCSVSELHELARFAIPAELKKLLLDTATNNETSFFRDPRVFKAIEHTILPKILSRHPIKIWSAACSTGQEALSIAMMIHEYNETQVEPLKFSILASDISERVLEIAKSAAYSSLEVSRGLDSKLLNRYFRNTGVNGKWVANPALTNRIEYKKVNLKSSFNDLGKFQIVFLRNVLIYQSIEGKKEILSRLLDRLEPGGFLVLGTGETLIGITSEFEQIECAGTILYRKRSATMAAA